MIAMHKHGEIPCASCKSWKKRKKKFSCSPNDCKVLTVWLLENAPHVNAQNIQLQFPEIASQYVV
jgi:hypothetical protein